MSHELDFSTGAASYMGVGRAWHRLGVDVSEAQTSEAALKLARLDWSAELIPLKAAWADGRERLIGDHFAMARSDTHDVLAVVGDRYHPLDNHQAFKFMDDIVGEKLAIWESCGAIKNGRKTFMLAKLPRELRITPNDVIKPYVLLVNSFDGSTAFSIFDTSIRVVCNNTLTAAESIRGKADGLRIRHTKSLFNSVNDARSKLGVISKRFDRFEQQAQALARVRVTTRQRSDYFRSFFPTEVRPAAKPPVPTAGLLDYMLETREQSADVVAELLQGHYAETERQAEANRKALDAILGNCENRRNTIDGIGGTAWGAYNALSEYVDHKPGRGKNAADREDNRVFSTLLGTGNNLKQQAYNAALTMAGISA